MPTVYTSVFQNFIRQGFSKSFTHGYAQSVVAATHPHVLNTQNRPSFARRRSTRVGRLHAVGLRSAFHTVAPQPSLPVLEHARPEKTVGTSGSSHGGLDAYFEHLRKRQVAAAEAGEADREEEWVQFQFPKRIEWKPNPASILLGAADQAAQDAADGAILHEELESSSSSSRQLEHDSSSSSKPAIPPEARAALAHIDAALEREIEARRRLEAAGEASFDSLRTATPPADEDAVAALSRARTPVSRSATPGSGSGSGTTAARAATPPVDPQSQTYADHLTRLAEAARYAEIPAVFEAMLVAGVRPVATAYNALLMAAIHLPSEKSEIVSKALDVYADMLRRRVAPDADTYNILVGLLAARSLEVASLQTALENKRLRYGGMDEPGRFMFASHELDHAILSEDDRLDLAVRLFESSVAAGRARYAPETYHQLIAACAQAGRVAEMLQLFEHMEASRTTPCAATFPAMITAFARSGDLVSAVECYNEYRNLAIAHDAGAPALLDRADAQAYAAVVHAYVLCDKVEGARRFYEKVVREYGPAPRAADLRDAMVRGGFVKAFVDRGVYHEALRWAEAVAVDVESSAQAASASDVMGEIAAVAADHGDRRVAVEAFSHVSSGRGSGEVASSAAAALLALSVREGDVAAASGYWQVLSSPELPATASLLEPTAMYAVAMIGSGQVAEGLTQAELMFQRIREGASSSSSSSAELADHIEEASEFIARFMDARGIVDPRKVVMAPPAAAAAPAVVLSPTPTPPVSVVTTTTQSNLSTSPYPSASTVSSYDDTFDPYAHNTDFKGSSLIAEDLEGGSSGRKGSSSSRLNDALSRFRNMRRAGRHPRYITYAKLISAAAREGKMGLCQDLLAMARTDVPLLPQYAVVRYGWSSILDAMVGACLTLGRRAEAEQYHRELLDMGSAPSANTFGLYITTLKESTKTFDEASEAVRIFQRAKAEGVEPSSFLYNALIGKLGKARRIDDCLFYFAEMRALGIRPTSVTYGTVVNALCRVSDDRFAEELFDEMEAMPNYKARPAPYNSMMQFFLTTKRDKAKVLAYYERMRARGIAPTSHTYKLLVDTHATLEPVNMTAAEAVLDLIRASGGRPEPVHYASLIHARGCVQHDMAGARRVFDAVLRDPTLPPSACVFQALFEALAANHRVAADSEEVLAQLRARGVEMTPYIANTLIHGWAAEGNIDKAREVYAAVGPERREPSTYEAMTRAFLAVEDRESAKGVVGEMLGRGYPAAVVNKVLELLGGGGGGRAEDASALLA